MSRELVGVQQEYLHQQQLLQRQQLHFNQILFFNTVELEEELVVWGVEGARRD